MYRASWRDGPSFSPPVERRIAACCGVSLVGTPSAKSRTLNGSRVPWSETELPTMSLVNIPATSTPFCLACSAKCVEPNSPCSSPATAMKTIVASNSRFDITRAASSTAATPDASSLAPGASQTASLGSVQRES